MEISVIKSEVQYQEYFDRVLPLFDCKEGSAEEQELELLGLVIEIYEAQHYPMPDADPISTIEFLMDQNDLNISDVANILNSSSRATEILQRKRKLSLNHIRALNKALNIPMEN